MCIFVCLRERERERVCVCVWGECERECKIEWERERGGGGRVESNKFFYYFFISLNLWERFFLHVSTTATSVLHANCAQKYLGHEFIEPPFFAVFGLWNNWTANRRAKDRLRCQGACVFNALAGIPLSVSLQQSVKFKTWSNLFCRRYHKKI